MMYSKFFIEIFLCDNIPLRRGKILDVLCPELGAEC